MEGTRDKLLMHQFPRRVRATFGGQTVVDTTRAMLLHETGLPPAGLSTYRRDPRRPDPAHPAPHLLPVQGHRLVLDGQRRATSRPRTRAGATRDRPEEASGCRGYAGFYWGAMDEWYDEDERVQGRLRDPYHRGSTSAGPPARCGCCSGDYGPGRDPQPTAAVRDRPAEPLLHPRGVTPPGPARAQRHAHRVPLQGHGLVLVGQRGRPQAHRTRSGPTRRPRATRPRSAATCPSGTTT